MVAWVSFFTPSGPFAAGGVPSIIAFASAARLDLGLLDHDARQAGASAGAF